MKKRKPFIFEIFWKLTPKLEVVASNRKTSDCQEMFTNIMLLILITGNI